VIPFRKG